MRASPSARSLAWLRKEGYLGQRVEHWNSFARRSIDLFGVIDIVCLRPGVPGVLGIQATTGSNVAARRTKCLASQALRAWLASQNQFEIHGWSLRGPRGKRKTWTMTREIINS